MTRAFLLGRSIIGVLVLALALSGCSALKLGYSNLPELGLLWLDRYFGFDDDQTPAVRQALGRVHQWHRETELPQAIALLQRMEAMAPADVTPEQACTVAHAVRERFSVVAMQAEPEGTRVARSLQPHQLERLAQRHARNEREFRREWLDVPGTERSERRIKQIEGHAERLYGRLEPAQRAVLRERVPTLTYDAERILQERRRRQADTRATLEKVRAASSEEEARGLMRAMLGRMQRSPDAQWLAYQDSFWKQHCALFAAVHLAASAPQREAAAQRLRGWRNDLSELAGRG